MKRNENIKNSALFNNYLDKCLNNEILSMNDFLQMNKVYTDVCDSLYLLTNNLDNFKKCIQIYNKNDNNKKYI